MQGILVQSLVPEDSTCLRGTKPATEAHMPRTCAPPQQEQPPQLEAPGLQQSGTPYLATIRESSNAATKTQHSQKEKKKNQKDLWLLDLLQCWCKGSTVIADDINHLQTYGTAPHCISFLQSTLQLSIHTCTHTHPWFTITVISECVLLDLPSRELALRSINRLQLSSQTHFGYLWIHFGVRAGIIFFLGCSQLMTEYSNRNKSRVSLDRKPLLWGSPSAWKRLSATCSLGLFFPSPFSFPFSLQGTSIRPMLECLMLSLRFLKLSSFFCYVFLLFAVPVGDRLSSRSLICSAPPNLLFPSSVFFMEVIVFLRSDWFSFFAFSLFVEVLTMFLHSSKFSKHLVTMILNSLSGVGYLCSI